MCNLYKMRRAVAEIARTFSQLDLPLSFADAGPPNLEPRDAIRITERAPIIRLTDSGAAQLVERRWSWPAPNGKPVYNFRSEGRRFGSGRVLVPTDGFYEFTDPEPPAPKRAKKIRWLFEMVGHPLFAIAGYQRPGAPEEAWTMLTVDPGPDVAPYHDRQVVVLAPDQWRSWLTGGPESNLLRPAAAGTLSATLAS